MVEWLNHTLQDKLARYAADHQRNGDEHLSLVMMAYCSSVHASTQYTPFYLLFGRQPNHKPEASDYVSMSMPESTFELPRKDHYDQRIAGEQIEVSDRVFLHLPARKKGQTKRLHSPWQGPYIVVTKIGDVTYRIQAIENPRRRKVVHCNRLKLCGVPYQMEQQHGPNQTASPAPNAPVRRPHAPPPYVPDETDLMYTDEAADEEIAVHERAGQPQEPPPAAYDPPVHANRSRHELRPPAWMRDFVS